MGSGIKFALAAKPSLADESEQGLKQAANPSSPFSSRATALPSCESEFNLHVLLDPLLTRQTPFIVKNQHVKRSYIVATSRVRVVKHLVTIQSENIKDG